MSGFDSFVVVDWSSGNDTGATPREDAIWAGGIRGGAEFEPLYLRNRQLARDWLQNLIDEEIGAGRRLLIGFDFPFGYPAGFAKALTGSSDPFAVWTYLYRRLTDTPQKNSRFELAGAINGQFPGIGPFWFNALRDDIPHLPRKGSDRRDHGQIERRQAEQVAKGAFTCWQMGGAGAVGGQVMTGVTVLQSLRLHFGSCIAIWPFETLEAPVGIVEIWPTLIDPVVRAANDPIRDRAQVRLLARALARVPPDCLAAMLTVDAPEEGWILGLGYEQELQEAACQT